MQKEQKVQALAFEFAHRSDGESHEHANGVSFPMVEGWSAGLEYKGSESI